MNKLVVFMRFEILYIQHDGDSARSADEYKNIINRMEPVGGREAWAAWGLYIGI